MDMHNVIQCSLRCSFLKGDRTMTMSLHVNIYCYLFIWTQFGLESMLELCIVWPLANVPIKCLGVVGPGETTHFSK